MSAPSSARMLRQISRNLATKPVPVPVTRTLQQRATSKLTMCRPCIVPSSQSAARCFSTSTWAFKGITPGSADPEPSQPEAQQTVTEPTPIGEEEYHERAEQFLEEIMLKMEELQEGRDDVETEYSAGVLTIAFPPNGTYVLNKQPPNKQIWLSSPITGPKRFDWVVLGEGMDSKEGGASGDWVYLRDNTSLTSLLRKELGITVGEESNAP